MLERNKELVRRYIAALNAEDYDALDDVLHPEVIRHFGGADGTGTRGIAEAKAGSMGVRRNWHHDHQEILDIIAEGDRVVVHADLRAVHAGEWLGVAPTQREVRFRGAFIYRIADGRIAEIWRYADDLGRFRQIGGLDRTR